MKVVRLALVSIVAPLALAAPAFAGNVIVTVGLKSGQLTVAAPTVDAVPGKAIQVPITVTDARGTGAGWTLQLLSGKSVEVTSITARCATNSTCTLPKAATAANGESILNVARDTGMGVIQLVVTVAPSSSDVPVAFSVA